jgi:hypothetical protein
MFKVIYTLDYEIHGNGDGSPYTMMIEPTYRLMKLFERYDAKLTILVDVAEVLKFKEYYNTTGVDKYKYRDIVTQLKKAITSGHDVQLHIHSSYFGAKYQKNRWLQNWETYNLAELPYAKIYEIVKICKEWLESNLKKSNPDYTCSVFRAANWSMMPSNNIINALIDNGIKIDTSVYKYGKLSGIVNYDYISANDSLIPWFVNENDICKENKDGKLLESPIYCEHRYFFHFITFIRAFRMIRAKFHKHKISEESSIELPITKIKIPLIKRVKTILFTKHPWKLDFNQASGVQLILALNRIKKNYNNYNIDLPIVFIGHSKSFIKYNEISLKPLLKYIQNNKKIYTNSTYNDIDKEQY